MVKNKKKQKKKEQLFRLWYSKSHHPFLILAPSLIHKMFNPTVNLVNDEILKKIILRFRKV